MIHSHVTSLRFATVTLFVTTLIFGFGVASAQEVLDAPRTERPAGVGRPIEQRAADIRAEVRSQIEAAQEEKEQMQETMAEKKDMFRERALEIRDQIQEQNDAMRQTMQQNAEVTRTGIRAQLDAASTTEERQAILETAKQEREQLRTSALEKRDEFRNRVETMREEFKNQRSELRAEIKTEVGTRIKAHLENILARLANTTEDFTGILERINNKITQLNADGIDTIQAVNAATVAENAIAQATSDITTARALFTQALESEDPSVYKDTLQEAVRTATEAIKKAHTALQDALRELKNLTNPTTNESESTE